MAGAERRAQAAWEIGGAPPLRGACFRGRERVGVRRGSSVPPWSSCSDLYAPELCGASNRRGRCSRPHCAQHLRPTWALKHMERAPRRNEDTGSSCVHSRAPPPAPEPGKEPDLPRQTQLEPARSPCSWVTPSSRRSPELVAPLHAKSGGGHAHEGSVPRAGAQLAWPKSLPGPAGEGCPPRSPHPSPCGIPPGRPSEACGNLEKVHWGPSRSVSGTGGW